MLQPRQWQIRQDKPSGAQLLEKRNLFGLLLETFGGFARRHGTQPFEVTDLVTLDQRQETRHPGIPLNRHCGHDSFEQGLFMMPPCSDHVAADIALAEHEVVMLDQPRSDRRHEVGVIEHSRSFTAHIGDESALSMRGEFTASEQPECRRMVLEQGSPAPAIEGSDRGDPRRLATKLPAEVGEDVRRDALDGVEGGAGHLEEADLQRERHPVQGAPAFPDLGEFLLIEGEEVLDLKS